jgi:uncharacterized zinc-type alcohol dehydrogenase-like protein
MDAFIICLSGDHNLCPTAQGTIVGRHGGFADRVRAQWTWVRPIPEALDLAKAGPLLCGGVTVFAPFLIHHLPSTARVGVIGIGGLGHMASQFANKWGCEVHAFTTSDSKEAEARKLGAHYVHNTKQDGALKKIAGSLDLIISTVNAGLDVPGVLDTLAPKGRLHNVGAVLNPLQVPAFSLILGQKSVSGSPTGSPTAIDDMLQFCAGIPLHRSPRRSRCQRSMVPSSVCVLERPSTTSCSRTKTDANGQFFREDTNMTQLDQVSTRPPLMKQITLAS